MPEYHENDLGYILALYVTGLTNLSENEALAPPIGRGIGGRAVEAAPAHRPSGGTGRGRGQRRRRAGVCPRRSGDIIPTSAAQSFHRDYGGAGAGRGNSSSAAQSFFGASCAVSSHSTFFLTDEHCMATLESHRLQSLNLRTSFVYTSSDDMGSGQNIDEAELNSDYLT